MFIAKKLFCYDLLHNNLSLPLRPSHLSRFKLSAGPKKGAPQRVEVRREYRATAVFLCALPISRGSNFRPAQKSEHRRGWKSAENTERPLSSSAPFPSLAVQTFRLAQKRSTAEGGGPQRIPSDRCLPLRPSHLSRFKLPAGPKKGTPQRVEVRREYRATAVFLCALPISRGSNFRPAQK